MKRRHFAILWVAAIVPMVWFHKTRGPMLLERDAAAAALKAGQAAEARGDYASAAESYRNAQDKLIATGADASTNLACLIAVLRAQTHDRPLTDRVDAWNKMLKGSSADPAADKRLLDDMRLELAGLHYESAYLQAHAGTPQVLWRNEADLARQQYAYVAQSGGDPARTSTAAANVERVYRLQQADRLTLMSRPLRPEQEKQMMQLQSSPAQSDNETDSPLPVNGDASKSGSNAKPPEKPEQPRPPRKGS